jgi:hypothetical protein
MSYANKGRLFSDDGAIDRYRPILEKDNFQPDEPHWRRISKNTISLFQVLIDQDLRDLVMILEHYPRYTEWVCEHFRYAYSYSENSADIDAASRLLHLGEPYFTKQFVRNLVRKLPSTDELNLEDAAAFAMNVQQKHQTWHPVVVNHYCDILTDFVESGGLHPLQRIVILRPIQSIERQKTFDYEAEDRDAVLDIPYMN